MSSFATTRAFSRSLLLQIHICDQCPLGSLADIPTGFGDVRFTPQKLTLIASAVRFVRVVATQAAVATGAASLRAI